MANPVQSDILGSKSSLKGAIKCVSKGVTYAIFNNVSVEDRYDEKKNCISCADNTLDISTYHLDDVSHNDISEINLSCSKDMLDVHYSKDHNTEWMKTVSGDARGVELDFNINDVLVSNLSNQFLSLSSENVYSNTEKPTHDEIFSIADSNNIKCINLEKPSCYSVCSEQLICDFDRNLTSILFAEKCQFSSYSDKTNVENGLDPIVDNSIKMPVYFDDESIPKTKDLQLSVASYMSSSNTCKNVSYVTPSSTEIVSGLDSLSPGSELIPNFLGIESFDTDLDSINSRSVSIFSDWYKKNVCNENFQESFLDSTENNVDDVALCLPQYVTESHHFSVITPQMSSACAEIAKDCNYLNSFTLSSFYDSSNKDCAMDQEEISVAELLPQTISFGIVNESCVTNSHNFHAFGEVKDLSTSKNDCSTHVSLMDCNMESSTSLTCTLPNCSNHKEAVISTAHSILGSHPKTSSSNCVLVPIISRGITSSDLTVNTTSVRNAVNKVFMCSETDCGHVFTTKTKLRNHAIRHREDRPYKCHHPGCDWSFSTSYRWRRHQEVHTGKKDFYCEHEGCSQKFTTSYNLSTHMKLHRRPCNEECSHDGCDERFSTKRQLEKHRAVHHPNDKIYRCQFAGCSAVFGSPLAVKAHARVHRGQVTAELRCQHGGCGKLFPSTCRLKQHVRQHTGERPYLCSYQGCTWAFTTASKLKRHRAMHYNIRNHKCDICGKGFLRPEHLKGHSVTHTGGRPFVCQMEGCDARFTAKSSLYVHMLKHKGEEHLMFSCPKKGCSCSYDTNAELQAHLISHMTVNSDVMIGYDPIGPDMVTSLDDQLPGQMSQFLMENFADHRNNEFSPAYNSRHGSGGGRRRRNVDGCARTDPRNNSLISQRARRCWQGRGQVVTWPAHQTSSLAAVQTLNCVDTSSNIHLDLDVSMPTLTYQDHNDGTTTLLRTPFLQPDAAVYYTDPGQGSKDTNQSLLDFTSTGSTINLNDLLDMHHQHHHPLPSPT